MNPKFFHKTLNLPTIPQHLIDECLEVANNREHIEPYYRIEPKVVNYVLSDGSEQGPIYYELYHLPKNVNEWITENIKPTHSCSVPMGVQIISAGSNHKLFSIPPHIDRVRGNRILHFFIDQGGNDVNTIWYQEPNYPLERTNDDLKWNFEGQTNDFRFLNEVYRTCFPKNSWTIMKSNVAHSVINIEKPRISISIAVMEDEFTTFCEFNKLSYQDFQLSDNT